MNHATSRRPRHHAADAADAADAANVPMPLEPLVAVRAAAATSAGAAPRPPRRPSPRLAIVAAASLLAGSGAGAVAGRLASVDRSEPPVLLRDVDRGVAADVARSGKGPFDDATREEVALALGAVFLALERSAVRLAEPLIREAARDGRDVTLDLRIADVDPVLASEVDLLRLREAVDAVEAAVLAIDGTDPSVAARLDAWAEVSAARLRAEQAAVLVGRVAEPVVVRRGDGGSRPSAVVPFRLAAQVLAAIDRRLERDVAALRELEAAAFREEVRLRLERLGG